MFNHKELEEMMDKVIEIKNETKSLVAQGEAFVIKTQVDYDGTSDFLKAIKGLQKRIKDTFDPIVSSALKTHREAIAKRNEHLNPAIQAEKIVKDKMLTYKEEQEAIRREQQAKLDRQAEAERKKKEEQQREWERKEKEKREEAERLAKEGKVEEAKKLQEQADKDAVRAAERQEASENVSAPLVAEAPKTEGQTIRKKWFAEVTDKMALIKAVSEGKAMHTFLDANMSNLNKQAGMCKDQVAIPGVVFKFKNIMGSKSA